MGSYESIERYREVRGFGEVNTVRKETVNGVTVHMVHIPEKEEDHAYTLFKEQGNKFIGWGLYMGEDETNEVFDKWLASIQTDHYAKATEYLEERDFEVVKVDKNKDVKQMTVRKEGREFDFSLTDLKSENYQYVHRHWDVIKKISDNLSTNYGDDLFYSTIQNHVDSEIPYANESSSYAVFSAITDILENNGIWVHS